MAFAAVAAGMAISAYGAYMQNQQAEESDELQQEADNYQAGQELIRGAQQVQAMQRNETQAMGKNIASVGGSGVQLSGSPALAIMDQVTQANKAIAVTQSNAEHQALALKEGALVSGEKAQQIQQAGALQIAAGVLSSGGQAAQTVSRGYSPASSDPGLDVG